MDPAELVGSVEIRTSSFEVFCEREQDRMARALALALDCAELGRDAAAEAMTRAWERWNQVATYDNPAGWVYRVGLNWGRSRLRRRRREVTSALVPDGVVTDAHRDDQLARALVTLSDDHRAVVVAKFYLDWADAETAEALAIPVGTVKSRLHRALAHLHDELRSDR